MKELNSLVCMTLEPVAGEGATCQNKRFLARNKMEKLNTHVTFHGPDRDELGKRLGLRLWNFSQLQFLPTIISSSWGLLGNDSNYLWLQNFYKYAHLSADVEYPSIVASNGRLEPRLDVWPGPLILMLLL